MLDSKWVYHEDHRFYPDGGGIVALPGNGIVAPRVQAFLRLLKAYADRYYSIRKGHESHYEDIFYLARQIDDDETDNLDNPAIDGFVREVRSQASRLLENANVFGRPEERYGRLAQLACGLIVNVVESRLATPPVVVGLDLLRELAIDHDITCLNVVTLNHDLVVEKYLGDHGLDYVDGFGPDVGGLRRFSPNLFDAPARIRLLKPHGSVNWHCYSRAEGENLFAIPIGATPERVVDPGDVAWGRIDGPLFLAGTNNKIYDYGVGIFAEQFDRFHRFLSQHDTIIVSGYGFGDKGINGRFWDWLFGDLSRKLIILHRDPEELRLGARESFSKMLNTFGREGRLIVVPKWMQQTSLDPDLRAIVSR
jgi:hypothetical protein